MLFPRPSRSETEATDRANLARNAEVGGLPAACRSGETCKAQAASTAGDSSAEGQLLVGAGPEVVDHAGQARGEDVHEPQRA